MIATVTPSAAPIGSNLMIAARSRPAGGNITSSGAAARTNPDRDEEHRGDLLYVVKRGPWLPQREMIAASVPRDDQQRADESRCRRCRPASREAWRGRVGGVIAGLMRPRCIDECGSRHHEHDRPRAARRGGAVRPEQ
jgi:hypothetical protein